MVVCGNWFCVFQVNLCASARVKIHCHSLQKKNLKLRGTYVCTHNYDKSTYFQGCEEKLLLDYHTTSLNHLCIVIIVWSDVTGALAVTSLLLLTCSPN